tara:strand:+ start:31666 stop:32838 length:1173 start_codon:yes stop_codon:yes gene_type:complete
MLCGFATANAQEYFPAQDPFAFDPDFRWFEPVTNMDLADMKAKKRANTGWFATYDRLNLYGSRPEIDRVNNGALVPVGAQTKLDSGWGHRYELGYMLPDADTGWLFNWTSADVYQGSIIRTERINRIDDDGAIVVPGVPLTPDFVYDPLQQDTNPLGYNYRFLDVTDSENVFTFDSYELNKTWRMEPYHYGGIMEPFAGVRWLRVDDYTFDQTYTSTDRGDIVTTGSNPGSPGRVLVVGEKLEIDSRLTENEMIAAQLGFHYTKFRDRFTFSSDFRVFAGGSYQCSQYNNRSIAVEYDNDTEGADVLHTYNTSELAGPEYTRNEEFVLGFDVRGELAYQLTRSISVRGGFQVIDIARGLWRGGAERNNIVGDNDQDLVMVGGTFGLTLNR